MSTLNAGIDYALLNNRIFATLEYYTGKHRNIPIVVQVPTFSEPLIITTSDCGMNFSGFEISVNALPVLRENFTWSVGAHFWGMQNEIVDLYEHSENYPGARFGSKVGGIGAYALIHTIGYPSSSFYVIQTDYPCSTCM